MPREHWNDYQRQFEETICRSDVEGITYRDDYVPQYAHGVDCPAAIANRAETVYAVLAEQLGSDARDIILRCRTDRAGLMIVVYIPRK